MSTDPNLESLSSSRYAISKHFNQGGSFNPIQSDPASDPYGLRTTTVNTASSSSLQALGPEANISVITPDAGIVQNRIVFSTVNEEVRAAKTLRINNTGDAALTITSLNFGDSQEKDNAIRLIDHQRGVDFKLLNGPTLPLSIAAGGFIDLSVQFAPQRISTEKASAIPVDTINGENYAALTITSNDPDQPTTTVNLAGMNFADYEGSKEPSSAEMARIFGWTTNVGTEKQILGGAKTLLGDEVYSPYWVRADSSKPVEVWNLAITSGRKDIPQGTLRFEAKPGSGGRSGTIYQLAGRLNDDSPTGVEVLGSNDLSGGENQKLLPKILIRNAAGELVNVEQTADTVDFTPNSPFALNNDKSWTDDAKNGVDQVHNWRMYPVMDARGNVVPHMWFAAQDLGIVNQPPKNNDFNDHVFLVKNARPENLALDPSVGKLFPGSPDLLFNFDKTYTSNIVDQQGESVGFNNVQLNKNNGYVSTGQSSLLDIDTTGAGVLRITSTAGSNSGSDNTLANGLQTTFDGRASKSIISTKLLGPLNYINTGNEQAGLMFGPNQDNYIKLVAVNNSGSLRLQLYFENNGVAGPTIGTTNIAIANSATIESLNMMLTTDPRTGRVNANYQTTYVGGTTRTGSVGSIQLKGGQLGHFFAPQSKAGLMTSNKGSTTPFTATFDEFLIKSGETTANRSVLHRLDVGASSPTDVNGTIWEADTGRYTPTSAISETMVGGTPAIDNTNLDPIYWSYRGQISASLPPILTFNLPVTTPGNVDVRLHFAEGFWGVPGGRAGGVGSRVFDVAVEGETVLNNFDITAAAGAARTAVVVPIQGIQVTDGELNISFKSEVDFSAIAAIEVFSA